MNKWKIAESIPATQIKKFPEINPIILQLLYNRNINDQITIDQFLYADYSRDQHSPWLFQDMEKALLRIQQALDKNEKIVIHGDYDADGVCSTCLLHEVLSNIGIKNLSIYIPNRQTEGYGLNNNTIKKFIKEKVGLIITVDCGVANYAEVQFAKENGIDTIITDHHYEPKEKPEAAVAIINPTFVNDPYPFKKLSGCGVAFKMAQAIAEKYQLKAGYDKWLLDLVAISTITDCMPLLGENRTLVKYGLVVLNKTKRLGLQKVFKNIGKNPIRIDEEMIAFRLGPRLNAAGRVDHANTAYELLATDKKEEAEELALKLEKSNKYRQQITEKITKEIKENYLTEQKNEDVFFVFHEKCPIGILGLIAGKIADEYHKPTFVITKNKDEIVGSGRSIECFNIIEAIQECAAYLDRFGGHTQACGFTLKTNVSLKKFQEVFRTFAHKKLKNQDLSKVIDIEAEIKLVDINWELIDELEKFKPYGEQNKKPLFLISNVLITDWQLVGKESKHLRLVLGDKNITKKAIGFKLADWTEKFEHNQKIDLLCELDINQWNGNKEIQITIIDLKLCKK